MATSLVRGITSDGLVVSLQINEDGSLVVASSGNASASNQEKQSAVLEQIRDRFPVSLTNGRFPVNALFSATAITPTLYAVSLTNANQEYSQAIVNAKSISFQVLSGGDIRYAYQSGNVATLALPYYPLRSGTEEVEDLPAGSIFNGTLYLASSIAGTVVIIKVWA